MTPWKLKKKKNGNKVKYDIITKQITIVTHNDDSSSQKQAVKRKKKITWNSNKYSDQISAQKQLPGRIHLAWFHEEGVRSMTDDIPALVSQELFKLVSSQWQTEAETLARTRGQAIGYKPYHSNLPQPATSHLPQTPQTRRWVPSGQTHEPTGDTLFSSYMVI